MSTEKPRINEELRIIPWWAFALAALLFVGIQVFFNVGPIFRRPNAPPVPLRIFLGLMLGTTLAFLVLLIGYVNRDAKRRRMNSALWTVLVIFIPNAIGFILYFVLRQPPMVKCPQCAAEVHPNVNFCPKCKYNLRPTCPKCAHVVQASDAFCSHCACELKGVTTA